MLAVVMTAMEEMQQRAGEQKGVGDQAEQMLAMLRIEQNDCDQRG